MFIQGDLQAVFDALYSVGAIDPVLSADWAQINNKMQQHPGLIRQLCEDVNACGGDRTQLIKMLMGLDTQYLEFIALEVAREYSEFQDRKDLH